MREPFEYVSAFIFDRAPRPPTPTVIVDTVSEEEVENLILQSMPPGAMVTANVEVDDG